MRLASIARTCISALTAAVSWLGSSAWRLWLFLGAAALASGVIWLHGHDARIRAQSSAQCQAGIEQARDQAARQQIAHDAAELARLQEVVRNYEQNLSTPDPVIVNLGRRLHYYEVRSCAVPQAGADPGSAGPAGGVAGSDGAVESATQAVFDACRRDALRLEALQRAWPK